MDRDQDIKTDQDPVTAVARKEKELTQHDLERARGGNDLAETFGRQNIGPTAATKQAFETKKKEDEKFERAVRQLLQQMREELERRLEELDRHIAETNAKIEELREKLETTEALLKKQYGNDWQEKLKRGDLDLNDPLLRQWLMQQQQLKDFLHRREKLIKERDELEKQIAEIEGTNLPDDLKLGRMKEVLEGGSSAGSHKVWQHNEISDQVRHLAAQKYTKDYARAEAQQSVNESFTQFAGVSFAAKADIGGGLQTKSDSLRSKFTSAADPSVAETPEPTAPTISPFKGPKVPS